MRCTTRREPQLPRRVRINYRPLSILTDDYSAHDMGKDALKDVLQGWHYIADMQAGKSLGQSWGGGRRLPRLGFDGRVTGLEPVDPQVMPCTVSGRAGRPVDRCQPVRYCEAAAPSAVSSQGSALYRVYQVQSAPGTANWPRPPSRPPPITPPVHLAGGSTLHPGLWPTREEVVYGWSALTRVSGSIITTLAAGSVRRSIMDVCRLTPACIRIRGGEASSPSTADFTGIAETHGPRAGILVGGTTVGGVWPSVRVSLRQWVSHSLWTASWPILAQRLLEVCLGGEASHPSYWDCRLAAAGSRKYRPQSCMDGLLK